jgi:hypothetical protein
VLHEGGDSPEDEEPRVEPYIHDVGLAETCAPLVDAAYSTASRWWDVVDQLRVGAVEAGLDAELPVLRELTPAASYVLRLKPRGEAGCDLRPQTGHLDVAWPPHIKEASAEAVALWRVLADRVEQPAARARFMDLLAERRDRAQRGHAIAAVGAYLAAARTRRELDLDLAAWLVRAWQLSRTFGAWDLLDEVCQELADRAGAQMGDGAAAPGVILPMLAAVAAKPTRQQLRHQHMTVPEAAVIDSLLWTALDTYRSGDLAGEIASLLRTRASDPAAIVVINRREVQAHLDEASATTGFLKQHHLQAAIQVARVRGLTDMVASATAEMQRIPVADLGLTRLGTSVPIPRDAVERFIGGFTESVDWRAGLGFFLNTGCPIGDLDQLRQQERDLAKVAVFSRSLNRVLLGQDGLPRWTTRTEEDRRAVELAFLARTWAENHGRMLAVGLTRMAERYGVPSEGDLVAFLSRNGAVDQILAGCLARALRHFWAGDYEATVHVVTPRIEAAARALLREMDEGIYRTQAARDPGQYPGLFGLLQALEELALDESWAYFLRWLLLGPVGPNVRNNVAHGFANNIGATYAALVLRAAGLLMTVVSPQPNSAPFEENAEADTVVDLVERPPRDRDQILRLLATPVEDPITFPGLDGKARQSGQRRRRDAASHWRHTARGRPSTRLLRAALQVPSCVGAGAARFSRPPPWSH